MAFGLRNVTRKENALAAIRNTLTPGGQALILEFSQPTSRGLRRLYDAYSFSVLPKLGKLVTGDSDSYQYLAESIRIHPDQERLKEMMESAGFERCEYFNLTGGIVAVHRGYRF
jgi:demethylmenaquinone methyltransferase/2-methoxy-6-polyprenyl-1,4-benzoquinol methylase